MQAPALHLDPKSKYGPCDEARAVAAVIRAARGIEVPLPIVFGRKCLGYVVGQRNSPLVWKSDEMPLRAAGFNNLAAVLSAQKAGYFWRQHYSKSFPGGLGNSWADLWPCAGDPVAGSYSGSAFTAAQFSDTTLGGMKHGGNIAPMQKHMAYFKGGYDTTTGAVLMLYDRVLTYEACTFNASVQQSMTNTLTAQRYIAASQPGLCVSITTAPSAVGATAANLTQLAYTNQAGTTGVALPMNPVAPFQPSAAAASVSGAYPFCPYDTSGGGNILFLNLAPGDTGVRKIETYTTDAANTGNFVFVLCRPIGYLMTPVPLVRFETDQLYQSFHMERIYDGACLSFFAHSGSTSGNPFFKGTIETVWG